jgi:hypothetical protein
MSPFQGEGFGGGTYRQLRSEALLAAGYETWCRQHQEERGAFGPVDWKVLKAPD